MQRRMRRIKRTMDLLGTVEYETMIYWDISESLRNSVDERLNSVHVCVRVCDRVRNGCFLSVLAAFMRTDSFPEVGSEIPNCCFGIRHQ